MGPARIRPTPASRSEQVSRPAPRATGTG